MRDLRCRAAHLSSQGSASAGLGGNQTVCSQRHIRMTRTLPIASFVVAMATFTVAGCTGDNPGAAPTVPTVTAPTTTEVSDTTTTQPTTPTSTPSHGPAKFSALGSTRLRFFAECPDLLAYMQDEATKRVTSWGLGAPGWSGGRPNVQCPSGAGAVQGPRHSGLSCLLECA